MPCRVKYMGQAATLMLPNGIRVAVAHGAEFSGAMADALLAAWPESFRVLAPDLPERLTREDAPTVTK